jgi:hypothetical protein
VADSEPKPGTAAELKDWLLQNFPVDLRWRCKNVASRKRISLKEFVRTTLLKAVEEAEADMVLDSSHEGKQTKVRGSISQAPRTSPTKARKS